MLRMGKQLRLTLDEQRQFRQDTGVQQAPHTIDAFNAAIATTVSYWQAVGKQEQCGGAKLLAAVLEQQLIR